VGVWQPLATDRISVGELIFRCGSPPELQPNKTLC